MRRPTSRTLTGGGARNRTKNRLGIYLSSLSPYVVAHVTLLFDFLRYRISGHFSQRRASAPVRGSRWLEIRVHWLRGTAFFAERCSLVTSSFASWLYYLGDARRASFANQSPSRAEGTGRRCAGLSTNAAADTKRCRAATGTHAPQKGWLLPFLRSGQPRRAARSHVPRPSKSKRVQIMCPSGTSAFQWRGVREQRVTRFSCAYIVYLFRCWQPGT